MTRVGASARARPKLPAHPVDADGKDPAMPKPLPKPARPDLSRSLSELAAAGKVLPLGRRVLLRAVMQSDVQAQRHARGESRIVMATHMPGEERGSGPVAEVKQNARQALAYEVIAIGHLVDLATCGFVVGDFVDHNSATAEPLTGSANKTSDAMDEPYWHICVDDITCRVVG